MVSIELQDPKISMIEYDAWNAVLEWRNKEGAGFGNCVLRNSYPPRIEVESPTIEVEADEEDTVEAECEAYDNGLDPELDYPAIESECVNTEGGEDDGVLDVQEPVPSSVRDPEDTRPEFNFIKVETT